MTDYEKQMVLEIQHNMENGMRFTEACTEASAKSQLNKIVVDIVFRLDYTVNHFRCRFLQHFKEEFVIGILRIMVLSLVSDGQSKNVVFLRIVDSDENIRMLR